MKKETRKLLDKAAIVETIDRLFISTDRRDRKAVRACLAARVLFDMSSLGGGEPKRVAASHYLPNPSGRNTRTFVGSYDLSLERAAGRWRISAFKFNLKYIDGNRELESGAKETSGKWR